MPDEFKTLQAFMKFAYELNDDEQIVDDLGIQLYTSTITAVEAKYRIFKIRLEDTCYTLAFDINTDRLHDITEEAA